MARGRMDTIHRPNTLKKNKMILCELRSRGKIEHRTSHELNKLFVKLNWESAPKNWKNGKTASGAKQEKMPAEHPYGPVEGFPSGSWWGIRMDCSRDRVHEPFDADIQEGPVGAVSLCTSHLNIHNDEDLGDSLTFTGSSYEPGVQSDHPLIRSYQSQVPFRLIRSYNLTNNFAPKTGYRYDGLYRVAAYWIGVSSDANKYYKFALVRIHNQEPPIWQESIGKMTVNATKTNGPQTRCNTERFSTNLCSETHPSVNEQDTASNSRCRNETMKFSFNKIANSNVADKITLESKRNTHDSAIVTRCISMKKTECPSSSGMIFGLYSESPVQNVHRILENSSKPAPCKLQNTNISIRTDLYDSSHNIQHETKKTTPMTFCRTFVSAKSTRVANHSHVGTLNLNSCGPCPREGEQESLIQSRSGMSKISATQSPCSDSNRNPDSFTPKIKSVASPIEAKTTHLDAIETRISELSGNVDAKECAISDKAKGKQLEQEQRNKANSPIKTSNEIVDKATDINEIACAITETSSEKSLEILETDRDETRDKILKEERTFLDSFTPDQMLKYIIKQKYHPTAKLLINSVIGLATGESTIFRTYDSLISLKKSWSRDKRSDSSTSGISEKGLDCRQITCDKSMNKERSVGKSAKKKRSMKERMFTMRLRRTRVSKRLLGSEKKPSSKTVENTSMHLKKSKRLDKAQQPFSKSTSLKNSKKRTKKRRSELANLAIDANIGPKIRGPRNRRLRGRSHIFAKKRHDTDVSNRRGEIRGKVDERGKKVKSAMELTSKRSKRLSATANTRIPQSRYIEHKKRVQKTETTIVERKIQNSTNDTSLQRNLTGSERKGEKRKVSRSRSRSREQLSSGRGEDSSKKLCRRTEKEATAIRRIIKMVDAATQCSERREAAITCNVDTDVEHSKGSKERENGVKIEWIDLDDIKSESYDSDEEEQLELEDASEIYKSNGIETSREEPEIRNKQKELIPTRTQAEKPQITKITQSLSAFVPVNISDSDFRIARLRSIGFRPIEPVNIHQEKDDSASGSSKLSSMRIVKNRVADEQYNKYTSEETTDVGYMDQELHYQDIEEDVVTVTRDSKIRSRVNENNENKVTTRGRNKKLDATGVLKVETIKNRRVSASLDDDSEIPWHGWRKFIKNEQAHWIGW